MLNRHKSLRISEKKTFSCLFSLCISIFFLSLSFFRLYESLSLYTFIVSFSFLTLYCALTIYLHISCSLLPPPPDIMRQSTEYIKENYSITISWRGGTRQDRGITSRLYFSPGEGGGEEIVLHLNYFFIQKRRSRDFWGEK